MALTVIRLTGGERLGKGARLGQAFGQGLVRGFERGQEQQHKQDLLEEQERLRLETQIKIDEIRRKAKEDEKNKIGKLLAEGYAGQLEDQGLAGGQPGAGYNPVSVGGAGGQTGIPFEDFGREPNERAVRMANAAQHLPSVVLDDFIEREFGPDSETGAAIANLSKFWMRVGKDLNDPNLSKEDLATKQATYATEFSNLFAKIDPNLRPGMQSALQTGPHKKLYEYVTGSEGEGFVARTAEERAIDLAEMGAWEGPGGAKILLPKLSQGAKGRVREAYNKMGKPEIHVNMLTGEHINRGAPVSLFDANRFSTEDKPIAPMTQVEYNKLQAKGQVHYVKNDSASKLVIKSDDMISTARGASQPDKTITVATWAKNAQKQLSLTKTKEVQKRLTSEQKNRADDVKRFKQEYSLVNVKGITKETWEAYTEGFEDKLLESSLNSTIRNITGTGKQRLSVPLQLLLQKELDFAKKLLPNAIKGGVPYNALHQAIVQDTLSKANDVVNWNINQAEFEAEFPTKYGTDQKILQGLAEKLSVKSPDENKSSRTLAKKPVEEGDGNAAANELQEAVVENPPVWTKGQDAQIMGVLLNAGETTWQDFYRSIPVKTRSPIKMEEIQKQLAQAFVGRNPEIVKHILGVPK